MKDISKMMDEDVVVLVRTKDREIYSEIIKRYEEKLLRYAVYLTGDESEAMGIVQNSFIKAFVNLNGFNTGKKFSSWIYRIVHNESMNFIKKSKKTARINEEFEFDSGINLEDEVIKKELKKRTHDCLKNISLIYSEPLTLFYLEEKTYGEISDILRIPMGTVAVRINRAKQIMKKICEK